MEALIFMGLQGAGKSTFFKQRLFPSHVRVSLDLLKTRQREWKLFQTCLEAGQRLAIDNTNPTRSDRAKYIAAARAANFRVIGLFFQSPTQDCVARNSQRLGRERVPDVAIYATARKMEFPSHREGFDAIFCVQAHEGRFIVDEWQDEIC